eukprot:TRINITY_DN21642_c0_g1_i1.p1 TRINITY_DN21642_c0_g1~~TRINITY_DN21642_c0_g1_i1.p1  ORF type:complete len:218 (+),score=78.22 TRINITY_DN21642_c0_g1_i1:166-819(+)
MANVSASRLVLFACATVLLGFLLMRIAHELHNRSHERKWIVELQAISFESFSPFSHGFTWDRLLLIPQSLLTPAHYDHWAIMDHFLSLDYNALRLYLAFQVVDMLFVFFYTIFAIDILSIFLTPVSGGGGLIQYLDALPAITALADFGENFCILFTILAWPDNQPTAFSMYASTFTTIKYKSALIVLGTLVLSVIAGTIAWIGGGDEAAAQQEKKEK